MCESFRFVSLCFQCPVHLMPIGCIIVCLFNCVENFDCLLGFVSPCDIGVFICICDGNVPLKSLLDKVYL